MRDIAVISAIPHPKVKCLEEGGMGSAERLERTDLELVERKIAAGSVEAMIRYADDALDHYHDDPVEMERRKRLLFDANGIGDIAVLRRLCGLAARTGDLRMCRGIVSVIEGEGQPDLGFYCYMDAARRGNDTEDWRMLLRSSASLGFLPARKKLASLETRERSVLLYPMYWARSARLLADTIRIALNDPADVRLPPWTLDQLKKRGIVR